MEDLISRQTAIDALTRLANDPWNQETNASWAAGFSEAACIIEDLPSAQPELHYDEWCTDCKEYDHERHCCPRWNHVIRTTLQEVRKRGKWIVHIQRGNWTDEEIRICPNCRKTFRNLDVANYCPNCGLPMEAEVEE